MLQSISLSLKSLNRYQEVAIFLYEMLQQPQNDIKIKLVLVGNQNVGKTSLSHRFMSNMFDSQYQPTLGAAFMNKEIQSKQKKYNLLIWDPSGQPKYASIYPIYLRQAQYVVLVYDITNRYSFQLMNNYLKSIKYCTPSNAIKVLVGNKSDLEEYRVVSEKEGQQLAFKMNILFLQTSAKDAINVQKMFTIILPQIKEIHFKRDAKQ